MTDQPNSKRSASLTAVDTFTPVAFFSGAFPIRIRGTFVATVTLQRSDDRGASWDDVESFEAPALRICTEPAYAGAQYRLGPTAFTSGTILAAVGG